MALESLVVESFGENYPLNFDEVLDCVSFAISCAFNKRGTLLAIGCNDGRIAIWDVLTRTVATIIVAHTYPVCHISWSYNGRQLASCSTDKTVCIWNMLSENCEQKYILPFPVLNVQFHPQSEDILLICPMYHEPVIIDRHKGHKILSLDNNMDLNMVISYNKRGDYIYSGNSKGQIVIHDSNTFKIKASFKIKTTTAGSNAPAVKTIQFSSRKNWFLVNAADGIIRVYNSKEILTCGIDGNPTSVQKLQDLVNKTMWKKCCFSSDGEYICAGSAIGHAIYIWEKFSGNLVKILQDSKRDVLLDVAWHPVKPIIVSISSGVANIWTRHKVEKWSGFSPDFVELDENVEYEERESEFDITDEDKSVISQSSSDNENGNMQDIDVCKIDDFSTSSSDDSDDDNGNNNMYQDYRDELVCLPHAPVEIKNLPKSAFKSPPQTSNSDDVIPVATDTKLYNIYFVAFSSN